MCHRQWHVSPAVSVKRKCCIFEQAQRSHDLANISKWQILSDITHRRLAPKVRRPSRWYGSDHHVVTGADHINTLREKGQWMDVTAGSTNTCIPWSVAYTGIFFFGGGRSTNSVEDRGQKERGSVGGSPLVRGSTQFANEWNPYSD
jgi:hypothetical protein